MAFCRGRAAGPGRALHLVGDCTVTRRSTTQTARTPRSPVAELIEVLNDAQSASVRECEIATDVLSKAEQAFRESPRKTDEDVEHALEVFNSVVVKGLSEHRDGRDQRRKARSDRAEAVGLEALTW